MDTLGITGVRKKKQSYADQVYDYISNQILSGELQQGDKIVEDKIAQEFGVSRTPIREALTRLQAYGLVHIQPRSFAEVVRISPAQANDIAQLRLKLEQMAFRLLCGASNSQVLSSLEKIADQAEDCLSRHDKAGYFRADSFFHLTVAEQCGNSELGLVYRQFDGKVQLLRIAQHVSEARLEIYMRQHFDLIEMIKDKKCSAIDELLGIHIVHDLSRGEL